MQTKLYFILELWTDYNVIVQFGMPNTRIGVITVWDGTYITQGRSEVGIDLYHSRGCYLYKVTGTSFFSYQGLAQTLDFGGKKSVWGTGHQGFVRHSDIKWFATKCYHGSVAVVGLPLNGNSRSLWNAWSRQGGRGLRKALENIPEKGK